MNYRTPYVNQNGIAILDSSNVAVGTDSVVITLNEPSSRFVPARGLVLINLQNEIPTGTIDTLPIQFTMNGYTTDVTKVGGNLTVADITGTGMYLAFYDRNRSIMQLLLN